MTILQCYPCRKATKVGIVWMIDPKDLDAVKNRKVGRPRKSRKASKR